MIYDLSVLATSSEVVVAMGSSEGGSSNIALLFLLSGFAFYAFMYLRYRNTNKRHQHESETKAQMHDVRVHDELTGSVKGVSNRRMKGANNKQVHGTAVEELSLGGVGGAGANAILRRLRG